MCAQVTVLRGMESVVSRPSAGLSEACMAFFSRRFGTRGSRVTLTSHRHRAPVLIAQVAWEWSLWRMVAR
jgi:hypothetical protein